MAGPALIPRSRHVVLGFVAFVTIVVVGSVGYVVLGFGVLDALLPDRHDDHDRRVPGARAARRCRPGLHDRPDPRRGGDRPLHLDGAPRSAGRGSRRRSDGEETDGQADRRPPRPRDRVRVGTGRAGRRPGAGERRHDRRRRRHRRRARRVVHRPHLHLCGDASDDDVLRHAGIERAAALVAAVSTDAANLFITLSGSFAATRPLHRLPRP